MSHPERGEVWLVDLGYIAKVRPCLDVQNLITVAHAKLLRKLGELDEEQLSQVEDALLVWLGFKDVDSDAEA